MELSAWLSGLALGELHLLARMLATGRVHPGAGAPLLRSYALPDAWTEPLASLARAGWTSGLLHAAVAAVAAERQRGQPASQSAIVCTRPTADGPELVDTSVVVRQLFRQAEREVLIAGFRVTEREMLEPLRREAWCALDVRLFVDLDPCVDVFGRKQIRVAPEIWPNTWFGEFLDRVWPANLDAPRAWYAPSTLAPDAGGEWRSMHVKTVVIDRRLWFVTSANFTQRGHYRNIELGALIDDPVRAAAVVECFDRWVEDGVFVGVPGR